MNENKFLTESLNWFLSFTSPENWQKRKLKIEQALSGVEEKSKSRDLQDMIKLAIYDDRFGWYLYLVETYLTDITKYEFVQGARVIPIFYRIGEDLELVKEIGGIDKKAKGLHKKNSKTPTDATIFEILCALAWAKNKWKVTFIPEAPPQKTPDFLAEKKGETWYVECKRLSQSSEYSLAEREKWLRMLNYIKDEIIDYNIILDITFHVELKSLADTYLKDELLGKLKLVSLTKHAILISNPIWTVETSPVNMQQIEFHLRSNYVKNASPQLAQLIGGKRANSVNFSSGCKASYVQIGNGVYVEDIYTAFGIHWKCDAPVALQTKARDIRRQLSDATSQFPKDQNSAIHIGLETLDGPAVERERHTRIFKTVSFWDSDGKKLRWVYCHFFQSYAPPEQPWVIDETISWFSSDKSRKREPLRNRFLIIPEDVGEDDEVHWNKENP